MPHFELACHEPRGHRPSGSVQITANGCLAVVEPGHGHLLAPQLEYSEICFERAGSGRLRHRRRPRRVYDHASGGRLVIPVGCVGRVRRHLSEDGLEVSVKDRRNLDRACLQILGDRAPSTDTSFPGVADAIRRQTEGVLAAPRGQRRSALIGTLCHLLPAARTFVACSTRARCREIAEALGPFVGGEVQAVHGGTWQSPCRVVCGTYASFDTSGPADWDMLIFEDAFEAIGTKTHENRARYDNHRVYAFIDVQHPVSAKDQLQLETLAGPVIYQAPTRSRRAPATIEVVMANVPLRHQRPVADPRRQKEDLWADRRRNTAIARLAAAFAQRDPAPLWEAGLLLDCTDPFARWDATPKVAVLVESVRHAEALASLLPDWNVLHSRPAADGTAVPAGSWADWSLPDRSILTITRAAAMKTLTADVVVMAAGGSHPQLPQGLLRASGSVLVVDFADDGHRAAVEDVQQRLRAYADLGCTVLPPQRATT